MKKLIVPAILGIAILTFVKRNKTKPLLLKMLQKQNKSRKITMNTQLKMNIPLKVQN